MQNKVELLYNIYVDDDKFCFCFSKDLKVLWFNKKFQSTFKNLTEGVSAAECFPHFDFACFSSENPPEYSFKIKDKYAENLLEVIPFSGEESIYVGILRSVSEYSSISEHQGIGLLSYHIRQKTGRIFNISEIINNRLAQNKDYESSHYMRDIERNCRSVLKVSSCLNAYYSILEEPTIHKEQVNFNDFITPVLERVEDILAPTNLSFSYELDFKNGSVELDSRLFASAILNVINISYLYAENEGALSVKTKFTDQDVILFLEDNVTDYAEIEAADYSDFTVLDTTGEPPAMKKIYYDLLKRTVELHEGSFDICHNEPGIKILIRLPAIPIEGIFVSSPPRKSQNISGRLGLVDIMLSDVTY